MCNIIYVYMSNLFNSEYLIMIFNRDSITHEIIDATDSSSCFIVYCLNKNPTYLSLHEVVSLFSEMPILILSCTNGFVKARCSMPQVYFIHMFISIHFNINHNNMINGIYIYISKRKQCK